MSILNLLSRPWAILPERLIEMQQVYAMHLRGEQPDFAALEAKFGRAFENKPKGYSIQDGVAVLPLEGIIAKRMNLFSMISGGVSTQLAQRDLQAALDDHAVHSIVLLIDSPGGEVDGTEVMANAVYEARGQKQIVALVDGFGASAAYWIASAASKVFIAGDTTATGSIGVVAAHKDYSQRDAKEGVKVTEITAGKYKRVASQHAPLSAEGRASIQEQVDAIHRVFVDAVARNRGTNAQAIADTEARLFIGRDAIRAGLADAIATLPQVITQLNQGRESSEVAKAASKPAEATMRRLLAEEADKARPQPLGDSAAPTPRQVVKLPTKVAPAIDPIEVAREAAALETESAQYGVPIKSASTVDHVLAKRAGKMNIEQLAHEAALERARAAASGIAISMGEAVDRVMRQQKTPTPLI